MAVRYGKATLLLHARRIEGEESRYSFRRKARLDIDLAL